MNQIVNKLLLVGDKFMPEMHLRMHRNALLIVHVAHLLEINKECRNLCKPRIQIIFTGMN